MKIEMNSKRILIEAETNDEERLLEEFLGVSGYLDQLRRFLGLELPTTRAAILRPSKKEDSEET